MHEPPAATADLAVLPGVLGPRTLRRTDKYASGPSPCGCPVARPSPRSPDGVSCIMRASDPPSAYQLKGTQIYTDAHRFFSSLFVPAAGCPLCTAYGVLIPCLQPHPSNQRAEGPWPQASTLCPMPYALCLWVTDPGQPIQPMKLSSRCLHRGEASRLLRR